MTDIVERLQKRASQAGMLLSDPPKPSPDMTLCTEAAALIASQARRIEELEKGLEPFAALGECVLAEAPQSASRLAVLSGCDGGTLSLEFSDLRAAISLLSRKGGE